jgi:hypothetical protein
LHVFEVIVSYAIISFPQTFWHRQQPLLKYLRIF